MPANNQRMPVIKLLRFALVLHLFLPAGAVGQNPAEPSSPSTQDQPKTCTVQGTVVSATTGQPLKSAQVILINREPRDTNARDHPGQIWHPDYWHPEGFTDAGGRFLITDVPAGTYHFRASKLGYVEQAYHPETAGPPQLLVLAPGDKVEKVLFRLDRAAVIIGRITDETGEPAIDTKVMAIVTRARSQPELTHDWDPAPAGMEGYQIFQTALTNDLGEYRLFNLPPGKYFLAASDVQVQFASMGGNRPPRGLELTNGLMNYHSDDHPLLYYPGVFNSSEAEMLAVKAGQEVRVDLSLRPVKLVTISGRVLDPSGKPPALDANGRPVAAVDVYLRSHTDPESIFRDKNRASTDEQGNFEIKKVLPGRYTISAGFDLYNANGLSRFWAEQSLEVTDEDISGLLLQPNGGVELSGKLTTTEATKLNLEELNVHLEAMEVPLGEGSWMSNGTGSDHVTKDGTFSVPNVLRTTYRISMSLSTALLPDSCYVSSATFGGQNVLEHGLTLADGAPGHSLEITLSSGVGQVDGVVLRGDNPVPGALVRLLPDPINPFRNVRPRTAWADPKGHFVIPNVIPGSYRAVAYDVEADPGVDEDDSPSVAITLTEKESKTVQLKFPQTP